jgi:hypothetical protein
MKKKINFPARLPPVSVKTEVDQVLKLEAATHDRKDDYTSEADLVRIAVNDFIAKHGLYAKHSITPPALTP